MLRTLGVLYSVYQIPVNDTPSLKLDGLQEDDLALDLHVELGYTPFVLLLSVWLLAYRKLQPASSSPEVCSRDSRERPEAPPAKAGPKAGPKGGAKAPPKAKAPPRAGPKGFPKGPGPVKSSPSVPFSARRVRWKALQSSEGTIFSGCPSSPLRPEAAKMLNEVFNKQTTVPRSSAFIPKSSGVCLLDRNRAQQLAILFRRSPLPLQRLCAALLHLDFAIALGEEEIGGLLQAWPTENDFQVVANYSGQEELRDVERCIRQMAVVPRSEARLKLLRLSSTSP